MSAIRHSGHQPSELSARPPALTIGLPLALLGGLCLGGLALLELALALLGLGDLPPVVLQYAAEGLLARYLAPSEYAKRSVRPYVTSSGNVTVAFQCWLSSLVTRAATPSMEASTWLSGSVAVIVSVTVSPFWARFGSLSSEAIDTEFSAVLISSRCP